MGAASLISEEFYTAPAAVQASYCLRAAASPFQFSVQSEQQLAFTLASRFVARQFAKSYEANCQQFCPTLLSVKRSGKLCGALGLRLASTERLYLEQYLSADVEQVLSELFTTPISRDDVVEIGNFSASKGGVSQMLLLATGHALRLLGYRWVVFTATTQVQQILQRMNWQLTELCDASASNLSDQDSDWGSYYAGSPKVVVGDLWAAKDQLEHAAVTNLFSQHRIPVRKLESSLRGLR